MPQPRLLSDDQIVTLVDEGKGTWRHTALCVAIVNITGCHFSTAPKIIAKAVRSGIIVQTGDGNYDVPPPPGAPPRPPSKPRFAPPPPSELQVHSTTRRYKRVNRYQLLLMLRGRCWSQIEMVNAICDKFGCSESTARANIGLARRFRYLKNTRQGYRLTQEGNHQLDHYGQLEGEAGVQFARFCSGRPSLKRKHLLPSDPMPPPKDPDSNIEIDRELIEIARTVRGLAVDIGETEIAEHLEQVERRAQELLIHDKIRAAGFFSGGGFAQPGEGIDPIG